MKKLFILLVSLCLASNAIMAQNWVNKVDREVDNRGNIHGNKNTIFGINAGNGASFGVNVADYNAIFGHDAGRVNTGSSNVFLGKDAGYNNAEASNNVFIGENSGDENVSGGSNTYLGRFSGRLNVAGSRNVFLGHEAGYNELGSDKLYIANAQDNTLIYGTFDTHRVGIHQANPEEAMDVNGAIRIAEAANANPGTIQFSNGDFLGRVGNNWVSLTGGSEPQSLSIEGTVLSLSGANDNDIDLSFLQDGVDDADNDPENEKIREASLIGDVLVIRESDPGFEIDLGGLKDGRLTNAVLNNTVLELTVNNEAGANFLSVDLNSLVDDADSDPLNEKISEITFIEEGTKLRIKENNQGYLLPLTGFNAANITTGILDPNRITNSSYFIDSQGNDGQVWKSDGDGKGIWAEDNVNDADNDPLNEKISVARLIGDALFLTEGGRDFEIDLGVLKDGRLTNAALNNTTLQLTVNNEDQARVLSVDLNSLVDDADNNPENELVTTFELENNTHLLLVENGEAMRIDLLPLLGNIEFPSHGWQLIGNHIQSDRDKNVGIGTENPEAKLHVNGSLLLYNTIAVAGREDPVTMKWEKEKGALRINASILNEQPEPEALQNIGVGSVASGLNSRAKGSFSTAMGNQVNAQSYSSFVVGSFNETREQYNALQWTETDPVFVVGNGRREEDRSNALTILKNGNVGIGISQPSQKLVVDGSIIANGAINTNSFLNHRTSSARIGFPSTDNSIISFYTDVEAMRLFPDGKVAIGQDNLGGNYLLGVNGNTIIRGDINVNSVREISDERYKKDIRAFESGKEVLSNLRPVSYTYNQEAFPERNFDARHHIGFLAQDVQESLPELVYEDENGFLSMNYTGLVPVITKAAQEMSDEIGALEEEKQRMLGQISALQDQVRSVSAENAELKERLEQLINRFDEFESNLTENRFSKGALFQNQPNPFNQDTKIKFFIPERANNAQIYIFDMSGKQKKQFVIESKGNGEVDVRGGELSAGMYIYSLVVDGKEIDTKKMILVR